jgi:hypothetical protein
VLLLNGSTFLAFCAYTQSFLRFAAVLAPLHRTLSLWSLSPPCVSLSAQSLSCADAGHRGRCPRWNADALRGSRAREGGGAPARQGPRIRGTEEEEDKSLKLVEKTKREQNNSIRCKRERRRKQNKHELAGHPGVGGALSAGSKEGGGDREGCTNSPPTLRSCA